MALSLGDTHQLWGTIQVFLHRGTSVLGAVSPHITGRVHLQKEHIPPASQSVSTDSESRGVPSSSSSRGSPAGPGPGRRSWGPRTWDTPRGTSVSPSPALSGPPRQTYLVGAEVPQHQQAVAAPRGDGHSDLHQDPVDGEQAQVLDLWPRGGGVSAPAAVGGGGENKVQRGQQPLGAAIPQPGLGKGPPRAPWHFHCGNFKALSSHPRGCRDPGRGGLLQLRTNQCGGRP